MASVDFVSQMDMIESGVDINVEINVEISHISSSDCDQDCSEDSPCTKPGCSDSGAMNCTMTMGSARCAPSVFTALTGTQSLVAPDSDRSGLMGYQIPIYHNIALGILPRPPKPVV